MCILTVAILACFAQVAFSSTTEVCLNDPSVASCASYQLPENMALMGVNMNCMMMPWMTSCSQQSFCDNPSSSFGTTNNAKPDYCSGFSLLKSSCEDMPKMMGCANYTALCGSQTNSVVSSCSSTKTSGMPSTSVTLTQITGLCGELQSSSRPAGCDQCSQSQNNDLKSCEAMTTYSDLCKTVTKAAREGDSTAALQATKFCQPWQEMCSTFSSSGGPLSTTSYCSGYVDCISNPMFTGSNPAATCASFEMPAAIAARGYAMNCEMMPFMSSCAVGRVCSSSEDYCSDFSLLKISCLDMPGMMGCTAYNSMCPVNGTNTSPVAQCAKSVPMVPSTSTTQSLVSGICQSHTMEGCNDCMSDLGKCDILTVYSNMCKRMSDMSQCQQWRSMCSSMDSVSTSSISSLCDTSSSSGVLPEMRMYFHATTFDLFLFREWVSRTEAEYIGTWFAAFFLAVVHEFIRFMRSSYDHYLGKRHHRKLSSSSGKAGNKLKTSSCGCDPPTIIPPPLPSSGGCCGGPQADNALDTGSITSINNCNGPCTKPGNEIMYGFNMYSSNTEKRYVVVLLQFSRSFIYCFEYCVSLLVMLVAMTFNVGWFLAVAAGAFVGHFAFQNKVYTFNIDQQTCC
eukprot:Nk52_evm32s96 gene=Nk52_evmTU32s96